jgi:primosomal protein N' (replication factor Y)
LFANIVVDVDVPGLSRAFSYHVPDELADEVFEGACVAVPFGGRDMVGYVMELTENPPDVQGIKDLQAVIKESCALATPLLSLAEWISSYYMSPLGASVRAIVPEVMSATVVSTVRLINASSAHPASPAQQKIVQILGEMGGQADSDTLKMRARVDKFAPTLKQLRNRGAIEVSRTLELPKARPLIVTGLQLVEDEDCIGIDELATKAPKQAQLMKELAQSNSPIRQAELLRRVGASSSPIKAIVEKGLVEKVQMRIRRRPHSLRPGTELSALPPEPTLAQQDALRMISDGFESEVPQTTLLYGVTGSGKTEVYLRSISQTLDSGRSCIALVPEISLTVHLMDVYRARFGDRMAILHSRLSIGERHDEWRRIESGEARVVLGARSAVFAPVRNLGLVVVDEEHEPSYKQDHAPRYNARQVAEERARAEDASIILGSATPSIETFYRASCGEMNMAVLEKRIENRPLPDVTTVDLREEFAQGHKNVFSDHLRDAISERVSRHEQTILFVNRRGYASFLLCRTCGYTEKCHNCDVSMTYHSAQRMLRCHHCDEQKPAPSVCPNCGGPHIRQFGIGTERVEEEVRNIFPEARVIRMDADTTRRKDAHARFLDMFRDGKADILVGTQMVAKGLDFPNVTLVGVVSADTSLHLPDFRAAERTFQLLTQVGGRGGRGNLPGETIIQSFSPDHYAIRAAARQDYLAFYGQEIGYRRELAYPPFTQLINIIASDPIDRCPEEKLLHIREKIQERFSADDVGLLGPAPAPWSKLKGMYRWHLVLKLSQNEMAEEVKPALARILADFPPIPGSTITVDVNPLTML